MSYTIEKINANIEETFAKKYGVCIDGGMPQTATGLEALCHRVYNKGWADCREKMLNKMWIPCSERLPNNNEYDWVLAQVQEDNGNLWIPRVMEYRESKDDWYLEDENPCWLKECHGDKFKVIAWMPLPPVFEGNKE